MILSKGKGGAMGSFNFGTVFAFVGCFVIVVVSLVMSLENPWIAIDLHSIILVLGGTLFVASSCFPYRQVLNLFKVFIKGIARKPANTHAEVLDSIIQLSKARIQGREAFKQASESVKHPFLRECSQVLHWTEADISRSELRELLELRAETIFASYNQDAAIFKTIAKFPPAFGLMGTTMGMIALLQAIGKGNSDSIGSSMSLALLATLYGLILANVVFLPIAEYLGKKSRDEFVIRKMIIEAIMLIHEKKPAKFIEEKVKSFLLPGQRQLKRN
jgi:chemotaxis protein MotA